MQTVCLPIAAFPSWKDVASSHKSCFAIYDPWIVLVAIYTLHSEKQETFWLQWTESVCTILREALFPAYSEADWEHAQGRNTEIPLTTGHTCLVAEKKNSWTKLIYRFFQLVWTWASFSHQSLLMKALFCFLLMSRRCTLLAFWLWLYILGLKASIHPFSIPA